MDQGSGLVRQALLTPGHVSDKLPFPDLVQGDEQTVSPRPHPTPSAAPASRLLAGPSQHRNQLRDNAKLSRGDGKNS
jgi:hypothetical protein